jgi:GNAT superfamily N-acetyltransferase
LPGGTLIRPAEPRDFRGIAELSRALAAVLQDPDPGGGCADLQAACSPPDPWAECLVAVSKSHVVGFVSFCRRFEAHTRQRALWIGDLVTAGDVRGEGVGTALLDAVRERARELGCAAIMLEVWRENHRAHALYARLGWTLLDDRYLMRLS